MTTTTGECFWFLGIISCGFCGISRILGILRVFGAKKIKKVRDFGTFGGLFTKKTKKVPKSAQKAIRRADSQGAPDPHFCEKMGDGVFLDKSSTTQLQKKKMQTATRLRRGNQAERPRHN